MARVLVTERVQTPFAGSKVDREKGVIKQVLICGPTSANGNDYTRESFGDGKQYEGRHVYLNHPKGTGDRPAQDKVGWIENVGFRANGMPEGDFHVLLSHPMAGAILESAERNPSLFGFSHVAYCDIRPRNGRQRVESVQEVESVDLVASPATTKGIFESTGGRAVAKTTLGRLIESLRPKLKKAPAVKESKRLLLVAEDDAGVGAMLDAPVDEPAADADPDDAVGAAFVQAMHSLIDSYDAGDIDSGALVGKLKELLKSHAKLTGSGGGDSDPPEKSEESRKAADERAVLEGFKACGAAGLVVTEARARMVGNTTDPAERKALIEDLKRIGGAKGGEQPRGHSPHDTRRTTEGTGGKTTEAKGGDGADTRFAWQD